MMYLIIGRTASGKDYFANLLCQQGLIGVKSHTTRTKRYPQEDTHIFVTPEEASKLTDRVAYTKIDNYECFATTNDVKNKDFYIIDIPGMLSLTKNMSDDIFDIIYIRADKDERKKHFINRQTCSASEAEILFNTRDAAETARFDEFEKQLDIALKNGPHGNINELKLPKNIQSVHVFTNSFEKSNDDIIAEAKMAANQKRCHKILTQMTAEAIQLGIVKTDNSNNIIVYKQDTKTCCVKPEKFAAMLLYDDIGLSMFIKEYLGRSHNLKLI